MSKLILIFSDGTGQIGGLRPDQCLSNVYKMYRAMRPGPDSPIPVAKQVTFYDPGLGAGEVGGLTLRRLRNILASAIGTGIDENVIDCYAAIISQYRPGDRICLFGFSRGAYTVRTLANVLNLCGVPTKAADGGPVPRFGPPLRKIARDAVKFVYNHGAGKPRKRYEEERELKADRFRKKYGSEGIGLGGEGQGNVQPTFIGVFDTVAALGSRSATILALGGFIVAAGVSIWLWLHAPWWVAALVSLVPAIALFWTISVLEDQFKWFFRDESRRIRLWNPIDWWAAWVGGHFAWWSGKHYDAYVDKEIPYLRHALSIDEARSKFPRVPWGRAEDAKWNVDKGNKDWLRQLWFPGNHSDIGGSYKEDESRLSDIALRWMVDEFTAAIPDAEVRHDLLVTNEDPLGLQHDQVQGLLDAQPGWLRALTADQLTWTRKDRTIDSAMKLHVSVLTRLAAPAVPHMGEVKPYRPANLQQHPAASAYYKDVVQPPGGLPDAGDPAL